jgi:hypothetical protein
VSGGHGIAFLIRVVKGGVGEAPTEKPTQIYNSNRFAILKYLADILIR